MGWGLKSIFLGWKRSSAEMLGDFVNLEAKSKVGGLSRNAFLVVRNSLAKKWLSENDWKWTIPPKDCNFYGPNDDQPTTVGVSHQISDKTTYRPSFFADVTTCYNLQSLCLLSAWKWRYSTKQCLVDSCSERFVCIYSLWNGEYRLRSGIHPGFYAFLRTIQALHTRMVTLKKLITSMQW